MKLLCFAFLSLTYAVRAYAIDFTPRYADSVQDGFPVKRLYFSDEKQRIYLAIPKGWAVSGNGQRGTLSPEMFPQATVILENSPLNAKIAFDEKGLETYRKAATDLLPGGASEVQILFERANEVQINGWTSFEIAFTYNAYGQSFSKSVLVINLDKEKQIRVRVDARAEHFEKLYPQARATLASWFSPSPELEAVLQRLTSKR